MKGLEKFVSKHVLTTFSFPEKQRVEEVVKCLEDRYGRTWLEKIEQLVLVYTEKEVVYLEDKGDKLTSFKEIKKTFKYLLTCYCKGTMIVEDTQTQLSFWMLIFAKEKDTWNKYQLLIKT